HGGARSMHMGGTALHQAAQMVLSKGRAIAAHLLQADADEMSFSEGRFTAGSGERGIDLLALAEAARDPANLPDGISPGLDANAYNDSDVFTFPELPTAVNPLGVKGAGQAGCIAAPQTIVNAILDALSHFGVEHIDMPATPERIWRAIRSARQGRADK